MKKLAIIAIIAITASPALATPKQKPAYQSQVPVVQSVVYSTGDFLMATGQYAWALVRSPFEAFGAPPGHRWD